jgi:hypothetical protein
MASMIRDPKLRLPKIKQSITLKAEFTSTIRAEGDADAKEFMAQLRALISKFKPKSTFKYTVTERR